MTSILELRGYRVDKCLFTSPRREVFGGVREEDGAPVVLKRYLDDDGRVQGAAEREWKVLARVRAGRTVRALALEITEGGPVLVLARLPGVRLSSFLSESGPVEVERFLRIARQMVEAVEGVHDARVLHRDIKPDSFLICPRSDEVHLIDFGIAAPLGTAERDGDGSVARRPEDTLRYVSPEQTGRMGRGVDFRSDLYALGGVYYHMLTGQPPFDLHDRLALVHAHIARRPAPPVDLRPDLPDTLSRIVLRLLQKDPEQRYQTAAAVRFDLERCEEQLGADGCISDDLVLASADVPSRPVFSKTLHGRESELEIVRQTFRRAAQGAVEGLVLEGPPGIGKSAMISALRAPLARTDGYLAHGKFDLYRREKPYSGLLVALHGLVSQWLTESEAQLKHRADALRAGLGNLAGVLVELVADLGAVLGDVPPPPPLDPQGTRARLSLAVRRFVHCVATREHPLVLVLDDLQWADAGSRYLIEALLEPGRTSALLLLGTYRSDEVGHDHPLRALLARLADRGVSLQRLELGPLSVESSAAMLAEGLRRDPADTRALAERVARKTGNSPLLIQQFVQLLTERGLIRYQHPTGWIWDADAIDAADTPESAVGLIGAKIEHLPAGPRDLLAFASCIGDVFAVPTLLELWTRDPDEVETDLYTLCDEGLIAPCREGFKFVHDRIREAAQTLLSEEERQRLHHVAGFSLLERIPEPQLPDRLFEIADHLVRASPILSESERIPALEVHLRAARRGLGAGAAATAEGYLAAARALHREDDFGTHPELSFGLFIESAESAFQNRDVERAGALLDRLEPHAESIRERGLLMARRIRVQSRSIPPAQTARYMTVALARLGRRWPLAPSRFRLVLEMWRTDFALRRLLRGGGGSPRPAKVVPETLIAQIRIQIEAGGACSLANARLSALNSFWRMGLYARRGHLRAPGYSMVSYAAHRLWFTGNAARAKHYADIGMCWSRELDEPALHHRAEFLYCAMISTWILPRTEAVEPLPQLAESAAEFGDLEFRAYAMAVSAYTRALSGVKVSLAEGELAALAANSTVKRTTPGAVGAAIFALIREGGENPERVEAELERSERALADRPEQASQIRTFWMLFFCIFEGYEQAQAQAELLLPENIDQRPGSSHVVDLYFYRALSAAVIAADAGVRARRRHLRTLRLDLANIRAWARRGPDFLHMATLLRAEQQRLRRRPERALPLYEQAAKRAAEKGYVHHAALAHERRASLLASLRRETRAYTALRQALRLYEQWGAAAKVEQIRGAYRGWLES